MTSGRKLAVLSLAAGLVGWSGTAQLPIPGRRHPITQAALGAGLAAAVRSDPGLRGQQLRTGLRWGALGAAVVTAGVAAGVAVPPVRAGMATRTLPRPLWRWHVVDIPLGTVVAEEALYRGALANLAGNAFGPGVGRLVQAAAFGLSHVIDARAVGEPVLPTVLATGAAGWVFGWLAERSGSILAPVLTHLAINEVGAVAAELVQHNIRRRNRPGDHGR